MRNQIASELRKLTTTRSAFFMLAALLGVVALGVVALVIQTGSSDLSAPLERQVFLHMAMTTAPLFALLLGLRSFTDEFRFGSIVPTLLADPNRRRVLGAKLVATAAGGVALVLASTALSVAVGVPILIAKGVDVSWSVAPMAELVGRLVGAAVLWSMIGVGVGLAVRHQVAAIAGALIWLLAAEGILSSVLPNVARYFPGEAGLAVAGINPGEGLAPGFAAAVLGCYALVAVAVGATLMQRRDIV